MTAKEMKALEARWTLTLPAHGYKVLRLDGRGFSRWTRKHCEKPFDMNFVDAMDRTAQELCKEIQGARFAYVQSDEISVLITDLDEKAQQWFGGDISKTCSVSASIASNTFNYAVGDRARKLKDTAEFDARVFALPDRLEVMKYFMWRQADAWTNAVNMLASAHFSHKELDKIGTADRLSMLLAKDVKLTDFEAGLFLGRMVYPLAEDAEITFTHKRTGEEITQNVQRTTWRVDKPGWFDWDEHAHLGTLVP